MDGGVRTVRRHRKVGAARGVPHHALGCTRLQSGTAAVVQPGARGKAVRPLTLRRRQQDGESLAWGPFFCGSFHASLQVSASRAAASAALSGDGVASVLEPGVSERGGDRKKRVLRQRTHEVKGDITVGALGEGVSLKHGLLDLSISRPREVRGMLSGSQRGVLAAWWRRDEKNTEDKN